ncbi:DUF4259 domain-containing protein [Planomonospora sp. ID67723]|uniref:DUF4259 domain-containing protein n=1 Tax=Planomonospora sp. ID67723 TaxID=2738134 RepID=UPI0018C3DC58|nr:DUF4259 domain-containing protein [Planomonospora sp. ID67723]MBG0831227.1 DUF4259 domain-containing protein [Planomonospora sp. ID67723]
MGTWDVGPFDNDTAADWCGDLHDAPTEKRPARIRQTLAAVAGQAGYLDSDLACEAIAAAAIVATQRGGPPITSPYAPDFLLEGDGVEIPDDLVPLALHALDRVCTEDSEWRQLWEESDAFPEAMAALAPVRDALTRPK